ncbi:hypothetical protein OUZ56_012273 [Daphnia magna]|uniref:Uncharacterized protein n=1 Tax=Daphnia magna TaxID=35525 RepID=A0ABQ9Z2I8_9CRUS|nr:hypothetical protein OUZ56_012273 [Daphnia magna]
MELVRCSRPENIDENQQWVFGTINTNPEILENFPETSIDELEEIQLEQRRTMTITINSPIFGGLIKFNDGHDQLGITKKRKATERKMCHLQWLRKRIYIGILRPKLDTMSGKSEKTRRQQ